jgi:hypothetical protein
MVNAFRSISIHSDLQFKLQLIISDHVDQSDVVTSVTQPNDESERMFHRQVINDIQGWLKYRQYWDIFNVLLSTLLRAGHGVAKSQTMAWCECGSAVVRLCWVRAVYKVAAPLQSCTNCMHLTNNDAQLCSNLCNRYPKVCFQESLLYALRVLVVCGCECASRPVSINNSRSVGFKHFDLPVYTSLRRKHVSIFYFCHDVRLCLWRWVANRTMSIPQMIHKWI